MPPELEEMTDREQSINEFEMSVNFTISSLLLLIVESQQKLVSMHKKSCYMIIKVLSLEQQLMF